MKYNIVEKLNKKYLEFNGASNEQIKSEQDSLDIISSCWKADVYNVLLHEEILSDDFFNLRTKLAGMILQKFINYRIKTVIVLKNEDRVNDRFREMMLESNKGKALGVFMDKSEAENWLLDIK